MFCFPVLPSGFNPVSEREKKLGILVDIIFKVVIPKKF